MPDQNTIIQLETGEVSIEPPRIKEFRIEVDKISLVVVLTFDGVEALFELSDWPALVKQIKTRSLKMWKFSNIGPPMGKPEMQLLLAKINRTSSYQLLLAGFDIAETISLTSEAQDMIVLARCISLSGLIPSRVGLGRLFFMPDNFVDEAKEPLQELLENNMLCKFQANIAGNDTITKYYMSYATPTFTTNPTKETTELWARIRKYYYACR